MDFLNPGRLWLLLVVAGLAGLYLTVLRWRSATTIRFTQIDLLDQVAPERPRWRRHVVAAIQLLGRILVLFDVSLSLLLLSAAWSLSLWWLRGMV